MCRYLDISTIYTVSTLSTWWPGDLACTMTRGPAMARASLSLVSLALVLALCVHTGQYLLSTPSTLSTISRISTLSTLSTIYYLHPLPSPSQLAAGLLAASAIMMGTSGLCSQIHHRPHTPGQQVQMMTEPGQMCIFGCSARHWLSLLFGFSSFSVCFEA